MLRVPAHTQPHTRARARACDGRAVGGREGRKTPEEQNGERGADGYHIGGRERGGRMRGTGGGEEREGEEGGGEERTGEAGGGEEREGEEGEEGGGAERGDV